LEQDDQLAPQKKSLIAMDHENSYTTLEKLLDLAIVIDDSTLARKMIMKTIQDTHIY
jgi:hypothetical protein